MNKKKICIGILAFLIIMLTATIVQAAGTPPDEFDWIGDGQGETATTFVNGCWILCVEAGGQLKTTTYTGPERTSDWYHNRNDKPVGYWTGTKYQSHFTKKEQIDMKKYQDAMYALINATDIDEAQRILWALDINEGDYRSSSSTLWEEALAYRAYYEELQRAGGYRPKDTTDYSNLKVYVNQEENYYTAGPFSIKYLDNNYDNYRVRFGEITDLRVKNEAGKELVLLDITDRNEKSISKRTDHNDYHYPTNKEEFYVKFRADNLTGEDAGQYIMLDVSFDYIKECTGTVYKYEGEIYSWRWSRATKRHVTDRHSDGSIKDWHRDYKYALKRHGGDHAQDLIAYAQDGKEVWDKAKLTMGIRRPGTGDDDDDNYTKISMKLSGYVFLDQDTGKVNEGNNLKDGDEALNGVEVTLYEVGSNTPVKTIKVHKHKRGVGGCCQEVPVYHEHTEECYKKTHTHIGNSSQEGGCYQTPVYHVHGDDCVNELAQLICTKTAHIHNCYGLTLVASCGLEAHTHTTECYNTDGSLKCTKTEHAHTDSCTLACGKKEHIHTDACKDANGKYTCGVKVEHIHTENCERKLLCKAEEHEHDNLCYKLICRDNKHEHTDDCYDYTKLICKKTVHTHENTKEGTCFDGKSKNPTCGKVEHEHESNCYDDLYKCGKEARTYNEDGTIATNGDVEYWRLSCKETEEYKAVCGKIAAKYDENGKVLNPKEATVEYKTFVCNADYSTPTSSGYTKVQNPVLSGVDGIKGYYEFDGLDPMKKYYIKFTYNGMLYTNVQEYNPDPTQTNYDITMNAVDKSKASENAHTYTFVNSRVNRTSSNPATRQPFNDVFSEIGSNPANYYSPSRGAYNQVFTQEEIVDTFATIMNNFGNHGNSDKEVFAYDCRISAYSETQYPLVNKFVLDKEDLYLYNKRTDTAYLYYGLYKSGGKADQLNVNLGIKARPTFDLALYKDVYKATLNINGKQEVYTYDARKDWENKGFGYGVKEDYYIKSLRNYYIYGEKDGNIERDGEKYSIINSLDASKEVANRGNGQHGEGEYTHEYRTEEIVNGNNTNYDWLNDSYESTLYGDRKGYAWRKINHNLTDVNDKLQIHVTYKIAIRNQSSVVGAITEIVDYYDSKYEFKGAYVGNKDGSKYIAENGDDLSGVIASENNSSIYGSNTEMAKTGTWQVYSGDELSREKENATHEYKTIYLRPEHEQRLGSAEEQYIYITFGLDDPEHTLINAEVPFDKKLYTYNMAEINGYKTYGYDNGNEAYKNDPEAESIGLIDKDSNPGNFNPSDKPYKGYPAYKYGAELEDDTSRAPAYAYTIRQSRTLEGNVFEDMLANNATASKDKYAVKVNTTRFGDGTINAPDAADNMIKGVKVELIEIKKAIVGYDENGNPKMGDKLFVRETTTTDSDGWYGFGAFLPGNYTIRFTYGSDDQTALTKDNPATSINEASQYTTGENYTSYNGQDYQSTIFTPSRNETLQPQSYVTDYDLTNRYNYNNAMKGTEEHVVNVAGTQNIKKYENPTYYWYVDKSISGYSDAQDDAARRQQVIDYARNEYDIDPESEDPNAPKRAITNHKAEVFNSYINQKALRDAESNQTNFNQFTQAQPMDEEAYGKKIDTPEKNKELVKELERRTYMYAYTPELPIEIEKTTTSITGNQSSDKYDYSITGVDFGVVERPRAQLAIDQDIDYIKVTASNGNTLLELQYDELAKHYKVIVDNENNYQWIEKEQQTDTFDGYDKDELVNIIMDDELLSGARLEVRYKFTVKNNSEAGIGNTRAVNIINYVANNFNFDVNDNNGLWEVVNKEDIQKGSNSTLINNDTVDLSTQTTILKATESNPLTSRLQPGQSEETTLTLKKTLSSESSADDLRYTNMTEIVEIDNEFGRYDHGAIPGNQKLEEQPREHDTSGASRYDEDANIPNKPYKPDGKIIITPPTGDTKIYYVLAAGIAVLVLAGVILIKKFVLGGKE